MRISLDTNVLVKLFAGDQAAVEKLTPHEQYVVSATVLGEFKAGLDSATRQGAKALAVLNEFIGSDSVEVVAVDETTSNFYAKIRRALMSLGKPIPTNDIWIAASAMQHGTPLVTFDSHFAVIPMLDLV